MNTLMISNETDFGVEAGEKEKAPIKKEETPSLYVIVTQSYQTSKKELMPILSKFFQNHLNYVSILLFSRHDD